MKVEQETELIEALALIFPNSKRNTLRKMLTSGRVMVDGKIIHKAKHLVNPGATITISDKQTAAVNSPAPAPKKQHLNLDVL